MIDVTVAMHHDMVVWPGDPPFSEAFISAIAEGAQATVRQITLSTHTGTHLDAPSHFLGEGSGVDRVPLSQLIGAATVIDTGVVGCITQSDLKHLIPGPEIPSRILFKTGNSHRRIIDEPQFREDFVALDASAAAWLTERHVTTVGIDYYSIEPFHNPGNPVHQVLLQHGVAILEGLRLIDVEPGPYRLVALPLKLRGMDGSPLRVVLENLSEE